MESVSTAVRSKFHRLVSSSSLSNKSDVYKINSIPPHPNEIGKLYDLFNSEILDICTEIPHGVDSTSYQSPACVDFLRAKFPAQIITDPGCVGEGKIRKSP